MTDEEKNIKKKTVSSILSLFFQSGYSAFLGLIANLVLTILLSPTIFGMYITVLSIISLLNYFSDIGLAASLIQKKEITDNDIKTTFTVQQILIVTLIFTSFFSTPFVRKFYNLPVEGVYLFWSLLISFFISSLKTIPSIFLERKIKFQKIVLVQVIENTTFYVLAVALALLNFGVMSFTYAVIARAVVGLIALYSISFWVPIFGISIKSLKQLLSFGIPFQASSFLALFKDDLIILFLGKILGFESLGYIGWAKKWAESPIRIIMDNISRVLFPVIARLQNDTHKIGDLIEKVLYYQTLLLAPALLGLALTMNKLIEVIPRYNKWQPALPLFYLFCISAFLASYSTPFINLFNALGRVKISLAFMMFWTVANWVFTFYLTKYFGIYGFPVTQVLLSITFVLVVYQAKKFIKFSLIKSIYASIISSMIMGLIILLLDRFIFVSFLSLLLTIILGIVSYFIFLRTLFNINLINKLKEIYLNE